MRRSSLRTAVAVVTAGLTLTACGSDDGGSGGSDADWAAAKRAIDHGLDLPLAEGLALESRLFAELFDSEDQKTGMRSFLESGPGKAQFSGR